MILVFIGIIMMFSNPTSVVSQNTTGDPWKLLVIVYRDIDVDYVDVGGEMKHLAATMPLADEVAMIQSFRNLPHRGKVYGYSDQTAELEAHIEYSPRPLTTLSELDTYSYWPSPVDTRTELDQFAPPGMYDSVIIFWQASDPDSDQSIPSMGWGLGYWPGWGFANDMTYASVFNLSWAWQADFCEGDVFLHEWLHGVTGFYMLHLGYPFPVEDLHGAEEAGYAIDPNGCWETWLRDYMRGLVYENGERTALVPETWQTGTITTYDIQGWRAEYYNDENLTDLPVVVRDDPVIDFEWYLDSPHPLINSDHFSARWTQTVDLAEGIYRFHLLQDDGARLWIDGNLVLDEWHWAREEHSFDYPLTSGLHNFKLETYEIDGWARAGLWWEVGGCNDANEPNSIAAQATGIAYTQSLDGDICPNGDFDYFTFEGASGDFVVAAIDAQSIGSELDSYIYLEDSDGNVLASNDDWDGSLDSLLGYQLPADGNYYIRVREYSHPNEGGPDYFYTLNLSIDNTPAYVEITSPRPGDNLTTDITSIMATATDAESGVNDLQFFVWYDTDWHFLGNGTRNGNEWIQNWDASGVADQEIALWVYAVNNAGNTSHDDFGNVTLDRTPPASAVNTLSATQQENTFLVTWSGSDNLSGVASYDVQYRDGATGTWSDWQSGTSATSAYFTGQDRHSYYFRARARDNAGNLEAYPSGDGDTHTLIDLTSGCKTVTISVVPDVGGSVVADPAPDCDGGTKYSAGSVVDLAANANDGYVFKAWSGDVSGTLPSVTVLMDQDYAVTAEFEMIYCAVPDAPVVTITRVQESLELHWSPVVNASEYWIFRDTDDPFFVPDVHIGATDMPYFIDSGVLGEFDLNNYYYVVRAVNNCGESVDSNRTGKFRLFIAD